MHSSLPVEKGLNIDWLKANNYALKMPVEKPHRLQVARILWNQSKGNTDAEKKAYMLDVIIDLSKRSLERYIAEFNDPQLSPADKLRAKTATIKPFEVSVVYKPSPFKAVAVVLVTGKEIKQFEFQETAKAPPRLDPVKVADRQREIIEEMPDIKYTRDQIESISHSILELFAGGMLSIIECCQRHHVKYTTFQSWLYQYPDIQSLYDEARGLAAYFAQASQVTSIDTMIAHIMNKGYTEIEDVFEVWVTSPEHPEGYWKPVKRRVSKKAIDIPALVQLRALHMASMTNPRSGQLDELTSMTTEELEAELRKMDEKVTHKRIERGEK